MQGWNAPIKNEITGKDGRDINGVQLVFAATPLSENDMNELREIQDGAKKNSTDAGVSET
jgi:hypothetical protein